MRRAPEPAMASGPPAAPGSDPQAATVEFFLFASPADATEVEHELLHLDGVRYVEADHRLHVRISYDRHVISPGRLLAASKAAGRRPGPAARDGRPPPKAPAGSDGTRSPGQSLDGNDAR